MSVRKDIVSAMRLIRYLKRATQGRIMNRVASGITAGHEALTAGIDLGGSCRKNRCCFLYYPLFSVMRRAIRKEMWLGRPRA